MKISITGHTDGIGKALADALCTAHEVIGFSRSNGYDISFPANVDRVIAASKHCDIFINNAYSGTAQTVLFEKMLANWHADGEKTIVNVNSRTIYNGPNQRQYTADKKLLRSSAVSAIRDISRRCRVININPGYVKTERVAEVQHKYNMLSAEQLAEIVLWCVNQPQGVEIGELGVWCTTLD